MSSSEKLMNLMHFCNICTRNCDHHILLIMIGNAHRESCRKLSLILVREKGLKPGMWKRKHKLEAEAVEAVLSLWKRKRENLPLPLPHRREEWREKRNWFCYPSEKSE